MRLILKKLITKLAGSKNLQNNHTEDIWWEGNFSSWQDAIKVSAGYDYDDIIEKCQSSILKVRNNEAIYERDSFLLDHKEYSWALICGLLLASAENKNTMNVIDFGGSLGSTYYQVKDLIGNIHRVNWNVVEQQKFVETGKREFQNEILRFYYTIQDCLNENKCNIAILSSVMQYLEDPYEPLRQLIQSKINYIIIDRTLFIDKDEPLITVQHVPESIYKASYPCHLLIEKELHLLIDNHYSIIADFDSGIDYCNYPGTYFKGFIMKRNA